MDCANFEISAGPSDAALSIIDWICPSIAVSSEPKPASNAATIPPMPMNFMKLPGLKNPPTSEPTLPNTVWNPEPSFEPSSPAHMPNTSVLHEIAGFEEPTDKRTDLAEHGLESGA